MQKLTFVEVLEIQTNNKIYDKLVLFKFKDKEDFKNKLINLLKKEINFSKHIHKVITSFYD